MDEDAGALGEGGESFFVDVEVGVGFGALGKLVLHHAPHDCLGQLRRLRYHFLHSFVLSVLTKIP